MNNLKHQKTYKKVYDRLREAQQRTLVKLCQGYPLAILHHRPLSALRKRELVCGDELIDREGWAAFLGLTDDDIVDPVQVTLDSLTRGQVYALGLMIDHDEDAAIRLRGCSSVIQYLKQYGLLQLTRPRLLEPKPEVFAMWDDWLAANPDKVHWLEDELEPIEPKRAEPMAVVRLQPDIELLDFENFMAYENLLSPGQQEQVRSFTLHPISNEEVNDLVRRYVKFCGHEVYEGEDVA